MRNSRFAISTKVLIFTVAWLELSYLYHSRFAVSTIVLLHGKKLLYLYHGFMQAFIAYVS